MQRLLRFLFIVVATSAFGNAHAFLYNSLQDGWWYCDPINGPGQCAWGMYSPAAGDIAQVQHHVSIDQQGAPYTIPAITEVEGLNLPPSGRLDIASGYELWTTAQSDWSGGLINGGTYRNLGMLEISASSFANGDTFVNIGHLQVDPGIMFTRYSSVQIQNNSGSVAQPPAIFELQGNAVYADGSGLLNAGHVLKTGSGTAIFSASLTDFSASAGGGPAGLVEVDAGELQFMPVPYDQYNNVPNYVGVFGSTQYQLAAGSVVRFGNGSVSNFAIDSSHPWTHTGSGGGTVIFDDGAAAFAAGGSTDNAILSFPPGMFQWRGGELHSNGWRNNGDITLTGSGEKLLGGIMHNAGTITIPAGEQLTLNSFLITVPGGTITLDDNSVISGGYIINQGLLVKNQGVGTALLMGSNYTGDSTHGYNTGTLSVQSGTIEDRSNYDFYGTLIVASGATLMRTNGSGPDHMNLGGNAVIEGTGAMSATYVAAYDNSAIEPAGQGVIGTLTLNADLSLNSGAVELDIAGAGAGQSDQLLVGGNLDAGGAFAPHGWVRARFLNSFAPVMGQHFPLIHVSAQVTDPLGGLHLQFINLAPGFQAHLQFNGNTNFVELVADSTANYLADPIFHGGFE